MPSRTTQQILNGLAYLKSRGIVHCDIKPTNLLLSSTGFVKICDFSIAVKLDGGAELVVNGLRGSEEYMAPELFIERCKYDHAVDVWAFGMVIYSTFRRGDTRFSGGNVPEQRGFRRGYWEAWKQGNEEHYEQLLGGSFMTEEERESVSVRWLTWHAIPYPEDLKAEARKCYSKENRFYDKHTDAIEVTRKCLIPMPSNGPTGEVTCDDLLYRTGVENLLRFKYFTDHLQSELEGRNQIMRVVQSYQAFVAKAKQEEEQKRQDKPTL